MAKTILFWLICVYAVTMTGFGGIFVTSVPVLVLLVNVAYLNCQNYFWTVFHPMKTVYNSMKLMPYHLSVHSWLQRHGGGGVSAGEWCRRERHKGGLIPLHNASSYGVSLHILFYCVK